MSDTDTELTEELEELPTSVLFDHAGRVYKTMLERSHLSEDEDGEIVLYKGHLTRLIKEDLNYSTPYYTFITKALKRMGCIRQVRRGGGSAPSVWQLIKEPTEEAFKTAEELRKPGSRPQDMLQQQMRDINDRLLVVEQALGLR